MNSDATKVSPSHLDRDAYLYVRQSTLRQVVENTESTQRQYALRERAVALGWPIERVQVIDCDQGQSGASAADREGFQRLVAEVSLGHAGIVLGLEVSRLARNNSDWHRLLEICSLTDTLILDEDGLYDPSQFNDRLLLGLKGTISEAELHVLRARLRGGILSKALRGELKAPLPVGFIYDAQDRVVLDPDRQVQDALRALFATYERTGSATATVKHFRKQGLLFPRRLRRGLRRGELVWGPLVHSRALQVLHNPRYAGAFFHGRTRWCRGPDGRKNCRRLPPDKWHSLLPGSHVGYITWDDYQRHQVTLRQSAQARGCDRRQGPPGEGPALLQGLVLCGVCGQRMTVRYHARKARLIPTYICQRESIEHAERVCQSILGSSIDVAIGTLLLEMLTPLTLEVALAVQEELRQRLNETDCLRRQQVERARYEADSARERFMQVDPKNRLVADALEADWNDRLRALTEAQDNYERQRQTDRTCLDQDSRDRVSALATDFPKLWNDPKTPDRERKRMARLLIEDVTLIKNDNINVSVRFKGGSTRTLTLPPAQPVWATLQTSPNVVAEVDRLLNEHTEAQIAVLLNEMGLRSGTGRAFTRGLVKRIRNNYNLRSRFDRLRKAGLLTQEEIAHQLGVSRATVHDWRRSGLLKAQMCNDKPEYLYEPVRENRPLKRHGLKLSDPRRFLEVPSDMTKGVQDEA
jgi:DNA invertase Pin-like site-specific DNA recombinase/DNA-binding transcriptional regulator YiaG